MVAEATIFEAGITYRIVRTISRGGMSEVYEAHQLGVNGFQKRVALKIVSDTLGREETFANFVGEAKLVADLIHANIGQIYHLGRHEGRFFIAMELIEGVNLAQFLLQHRDLGRRAPADLAIFIVSRIARGLAYAHEKHDARGRSLGLVHRDVNPTNVMLSFEGDVKLVDFGVAKAKYFMADDEERVVAGKLDYMSPEQINFKRTDHRSDLFSTCVVLCELLTGERPFNASSVGDARRKILAFEPEAYFKRFPDAFVDDGLRAIVARGMARDPAARFELTRELMVELEKHLYSAGYGPTGETLAAYLQGLFPRSGPPPDLGHDEPTVIVSGST